MTVLPAALSIILALLALMTFSMLNRSESTLMWQISVVAKEYGHYAAIVTVVVAAALLLTAPPFLVDARSCSCPGARVERRVCLASVIGPQVAA